MTNRIFIPFLILFLSIISIAFSPIVEKTLVKSIYNVSPKKTIILNLKDQVKVKRWGKEFVRVNTTVTYKNANMTLLRYFVKKGRYDLEVRKTYSSIQIAPSSDFFKVKLNKKGTQLLEENIKYTIHLPKSMDIKLIDEKGEMINIPEPKRKKRRS